MIDRAAFAKFAVGLIALSPIWGALAWTIWRGSIAPRLMPSSAIKAMADELIAKHGSRAEQMAFIEEDRAWRYSDPFEQGKWYRVRKELWRRYDDGEWSGPKTEGDLPSSDCSIRPKGLRLDTRS